MPLPVETEMDTTSVVLVGLFNPAIFHPMWFAAQDMISKEDAEAAEVDIVHADVAAFRTRQIKVMVEQNRFIASCEAIHRSIVRDLVLSCFGRVLIHCPIKMLGINRELHFSCGTEAKRSAFGFSLAPLEPWGSWGEEIGEDVAADKAHGGMMTLQMRQTPRPDKRQGYIQTEIQPSQHIRGNTGIFVRVNNHFEFAMDQEHPAQSAMDTLDETWQAANEKAESIIGDMMHTALGAK